MTQKVKQIVTGHSSGPLASRFAYAKLDCGHSCNVALRPYRGTCMKCGLETELAGAGRATVCRDCGCRSFYVVFSPNPHDEADRLTKVGDSYECEDCEKQHVSYQRARNLNPGEIHHARYKPDFGGRYLLFRRDPKSPSGFFLVTTLPATPEAEAILRELRIPAISPTERA